MDSLSQDRFPSQPPHLEDTSPTWFAHIRDYLIDHHKGQVADMTWTSNIATFLHSPNRSLAHMHAAPASFVESKRLASTGGILHTFHVFLEEVTYVRENTGSKYRERGTMCFPTDPKHFSTDKEQIQQMARCETVSFLQPWNAQMPNPERHLETARFNLMTRYIRHNLTVDSSMIFADRATMDAVAKTTKHFGLVLRRTLGSTTLGENEAGKIVRVIVEPRMDDLESMERRSDT